MVHLFLCAHVYTYMCIHVCMYTRIYVYTHMYMSCTGGLRVELSLSRKEELFAAKTLLTNRCVHHRARTCTHEYSLGVRARVSICA